MIGSTGRWPRVVNLWEMDGWQHWAGSLERQFLPERQDPHLAPWWRAASQWRSGGRDRILEPTGYCPTLQTLRSSGFTSWVCVQSLVQVRPGRRTAYLDAVGTTLRPILETRGLRLLGAYAAALSNDEVVLLWAAADFPTVCGFYEARGTDLELRDWDARVAAWRDGLQSVWLVPSPACFFYPQAAASS